MEKIDSERDLKELHDIPVGGHFEGDTIDHKILRKCYYWLMLFKVSSAYARKC